MILPRSPLFTAVALALMSLALGCTDKERLSKFEKQNQELQDELKKQQSSVANYDLQAKCAADSKVWFRENWSGSDKDTILLNYTNHYNKAKNKCFVLVEYHYSIGKGSTWANSMSLWDVQENSKYGQFGESHRSGIIEGKFQASDLLLECQVLGQKCKSLGEYNDLVHPYMND